MDHSVIKTIVLCSVLGACTVPAPLVGPPSLSIVPASYYRLRPVYEDVRGKGRLFKPHQISGYQLDQVNASIQAGDIQIEGKKEDIQKILDSLQWQVKYLRGTLDKQDQDIKNGNR